MAALITHQSAGPSAYSESDANLKSVLTLNHNFSLDRSDYRVRLVGEQGHLRSEVNRLVTNLYGLRGLGTVSPIRSERQPGQITIAASRGENVFGTLTIGMDSDGGLLADSLYGEEIDALRKQGRRLCEVTRLALGSHLSCLEPMATLFNVAFLLASNVHARTDLLAEVHPRHVGFYRRTMGYRVVGPERICLRVGAPAVLMHLCLNFAGSQIRELAGSCFGQDRNLYRLFLSVAEQDALLEKLIVLSYGSSR